MQNPLFAQASLRDYLVGRRDAMVSELSRVDGDQLLAFVPETLAEGVAERFRIDAITLEESRQRVDVKEALIDARGLRDRAVFDHSRPVPVDGTKITLSVPFSGDAGLFDLQPNSHGGTLPRASVQGNELVFVNSWPDTPPPDAVKTWVSQSIASVKRQLDWQSADISAHNDQLKQLALDAITRRRTTLLAKRELQASLPFPMTARPDAPSTFTPSGIKRRPPIVPVLQSSGPAFAPEPSLSKEQFGDILRIIRAIGNSLERSPAAFATLEEEQLRSVFLASLNAQFEGGATGETFNAAGKTDILIRHADRNLFIGECKFWSGPSGFTEAIDQALSYLTWRDSHAAVILFVQNRDFGAVLDKIAPTVREHPQFVRDIGSTAPSEWHFTFAQRHDVKRELTLAVQAFHLTN